MPPSAKKTTPQSLCSKRRRSKFHQRSFVCPFFQNNVVYKKPPPDAMPELSPKTKQYHKQRVRSLMVQQPTITIEGMRRQLATQDLPLDRHYIASLVKAIQTERIKRSETWTLNFALASFQDVMTEIVERAWEIANDPMSERSDRLTNHFSDRSVSCPARWPRICHPHSRSPYRAS
jgi:hypothetical protein